MVARLGGVGREISPTVRDARIADVKMAAETFGGIAPGTYVARRARGYSNCPIFLGA